MRSGAKKTGHDSIRLGLILERDPVRFFKAPPHCAAAGSLKSIPSPTSSTASLGDRVVRDGDLTPAIGRDHGLAAYARDCRA